VLTITGTANESDYQQVLRTITYHNTSQNADNTTRILTITVEDSVFASNVSDISNSGADIQRRADDSEQRLNDLPKAIQLY
jgi:hypothetical protein